MGGLNGAGSGRRRGLFAVLPCLALVLAALIGLAGRAIAQDGAGPVLPIQFESGGAKLRGALYEPAGKGPFPAIVVVHGASGGTRGYPLYRHLVRSMTGIGVAVLVYDRRGSGESEGTLAQTDYDGLARDVVAGVDAIRVRGDIDRRRIGLWGHSQGGWIAPAAYRLAPDRIAFLILVSGSGVTPAAQMEYAARAQILAAGYGPQAAARAVEVRRLRDGFFRGTIARGAAQQAIDAAAKEPWFGSLFIGPRLPADPKAERWTREMDVSVTPDLCRVAVPIALFYGERDAWVPVERSIAAWRSCLQPLRTPFEVHRIPGAGHNMIVGESANYDPDAPGQDFSTNYRDALLGFVRRWTRAP